ncbi:hypothetical protein [Cupriavidus basilensis]|uniref:Cyclase family protein n=1 Tax=Cupriavidus basilensis TaxID=68895 RepID=A0A0C4Y521_9BURK|nr:hypothetical protein [Cupriavidus basilensis]AJG20492.1 Cyclase family protein [Cupriavidus basilensis]
MLRPASACSGSTLTGSLPGNCITVHTYLLAQQGAPIIELVNLDALSRERVYQFALIGASLKFRGAAPRRSGRSLCRTVRRGVHCTLQSAAA